jgi:two-component system sensor histidine kinase AlgZ
MNPILTGRSRVALFVAVVLPAAGLLTVLLALTGSTPWLEATLLSLPLVTVYGLLCLGAGYSCRALPFTGAGSGKLALTHVGTAAISSAIWTALAQGLARLLELLNVSPGALARLAPQTGILFSLGLLVYLLAVAVHYLTAAFEQSRQAEQRALKADLAARKAELKALKAQIDPHFLFNSLNSINALVGQDPGAAREVCAGLGGLFRDILKQGPKQTITLEEELSMTRRYLVIEKVRLGDRLTVEEKVDTASMRCPVPPLVLQPLIENALKHGISQRLEGGVLGLTIELEHRRLRIEVTNPVDPDAVQRPGTGTGLSNHRSRLKAQYHGAARLVAERTSGGYRAEVVLPVGVGATEMEANDGEA